MVEDHPPHRLPNGRARSDSRYPDHRERIARARQAAEALFAPKPRRAEPPGACPAPAVGQAVRVVRILETSKPTSVPGVKASIDTEAGAGPDNPCVTVGAHPYLGEVRHDDRPGCEALRGSRRHVALRQAAGARAVYLAVAGRRRGGDLGRSVGLYARRNRLEKPTAHLEAGGRRLNLRRIDLPYG